AGFEALEEEGSPFTLTTTEDAQGNLERIDFEDERSVPPYGGLQRSTTTRLPDVPDLDARVPAASDVVAASALPAYAVLTDGSYAPGCWGPEDQAWIEDRRRCLDEHVSELTLQQWVEVPASDPGLPSECRGLG
ncbi:hypothetical protein B7486_78705, partial [cyanobacterium TDX16]